MDHSLDRGGSILSLAAGSSKLSLGRSLWPQPCRAASPLQSSGKPYTLSFLAPRRCTVMAINASILGQHNPKELTTQYHAFLKHLHGLCGLHRGALECLVGDRVVVTFNAARANSSHRCAWGMTSLIGPGDSLHPMGTTQPDQPHRGGCSRAYPSPKTAAVEPGHPYGGPSRGRRFRSPTPPLLMWFSTLVAGAFGASQTLRLQ